LFGPVGSECVSSLLQGTNSTIRFAYAYRLVLEAFAERLNKLPLLCRGPSVVFIKLIFDPELLVLFGKLFGFIPPVSPLGFLGRGSETVKAFNRSPGFGGDVRLTGKHWSLN